MLVIPQVGAIILLTFCRTTALDLVLGEGNVNRCLQCLISPAPGPCASSTDAPFHNRPLRNLESFTLVSENRNVTGTLGVGCERLNSDISIDDVSGGGDGHLSKPPDFTFVTALARKASQPVRQAKRLLAYNSVNETFSQKLKVFASSQAFHLILISSVSCRSLVLNTIQPLRRPPSSRCQCLHCFPKPPYRSPLPRILYNCILPSLSKSRLFSSKRIGLAQVHCCMLLAPHEGIMRVPRRKIASRRLKRRRSIIALGWGVAAQNVFLCAALALKKRRQKKKTKIGIKNNREKRSYFFHTTG